MRKETGRVGINIPNILTIIRIILTPLLVILLLRDLIGAALIVFAIAGISDALDGLVARLFNQRTVLGSFLDPIADKMLLSASFIAMAVLGLMPPWVSVVVISRDVVIVIGIAVLFITGSPFEVRPTFISKCTTTMQIVTVVYILMSGVTPLPEVLKAVLCWLTAGLTILSGLHYIYIGMHILQKGSGSDSTRGAS